MALTLNFFNISENSKFKFLEGPFKNLIFSILEITRKIKVLIGNLEANINKNNLFLKQI